MRTMGSCCDFLEVRLTVLTDSVRSVKTPLSCVRCCLWWSPVSFWTCAGPPSSLAMLLRVLAESFFG